MKRSVKRNSMLMTIPAILLCLSACSSVPQTGGTDADKAVGTAGTDAATEAVVASAAVDFDHELDTYEPARDSYNFYFTYKTVHPWWDAVALGMEDAQRQFLDKGITITYEYMAPDAASAEDQTKRLHMAENAGYDVIGVDVADEDIISPVS